MNHALKRRSNVSLQDLIEMTEEVTDEHVWQQINASWRAQTRLSLRSNVENWTQILQQSLTEFAADKLTEQLAIAIEEKYSILTEGDSIFVVDSKAQKLAIDANKPSCECGFTANFGLACRHVLTVWNKRVAAESSAFNALTLMCIEKAHPRWTHDALERALNAAPTSDDSPVIRHHINVRMRGHEHVPQTQKMQQVAVCAEAAKLMSFANKDVLHSTLALRLIRELNARLDIEIQHELERVAQSANESTALRSNNESAPESVLITGAAPITGSAPPASGSAPVDPANPAPAPVPMNESAPSAPAPVHSDPPKKGSKRTNDRKQGSNKKSKLSAKQRLRNAIECDD